MAFAVKAVIDKVSREGGLKQGDVFIFNDPYDGGTHLSDFRLVKPVFRNGSVFCYLALDEDASDVKVVKTPSTKGDQSVGFLEGILRITDSLEQVATIIHGTSAARASFSGLAYPLIKNRHTASHPQSSR